MSMNFGLYRASRKVYHALSPRERVGMTPAKMVTLLAQQGVLANPSFFVNY